MLVQRRVIPDIMDAVVQKHCKSLTQNTTQCPPD